MLTTIAFPFLVFTIVAACLAMGHLVVKGVQFIWRKRT
jgi:hypothetical protein